MDQVQSSERTLPPTTRPRQHAVNTVVAGGVGLTNISAHQSLCLILSKFGSSTPTGVSVQGHPKYEKMLPPRGLAPWILLVYLRKFDPNPPPTLLLSCSITYTHTQREKREGEI